MKSNLNIHTEQLFVEAYGGRQAEWYASLLSDVIKHGKAGNILDLGAGLGLFVELAHKWGIAAAGLEASSYAVVESLKRAPGINMQLHDLGDLLPIPNGSVSNVMLFQVVEHIDIKRFHVLLAECHRVLEQGGMLFIYSPSKYNVKERLEPTHINMMLPSELKRKLKSFGYRVLYQPDHGLWFTATNIRIVNIAAKALLFLFPHDWFSASANAIAQKI